jgi:hypothetical protein
MLDACATFCPTPHDSAPHAGKSVMPSCSLQGILPTAQFLESVYTTTKVVEKKEIGLRHTQDLFLLGPDVARALWWLGGWEVGKHCRLANLVQIHH